MKFSRLLSNVFFLFTLVSVIYSCMEDDNPGNSCEFLTGFENLATNTNYSPNSSFNSDGILLNVADFKDMSCSNVTGNFVEINQSMYSGGTGNELRINNANIEFLITQLIQEISFDAGHWGGISNIEINNVCKVFNSPTEINNTVIGGVQVIALGDHNTPGKWTLLGDISSFSVGGQEFAIDNVHIVCDE